MMNSSAQVNSVVVVGLDGPGRAVAASLRGRGVRVLAVEAGRGEVETEDLERMRRLGVELAGADDLAGEGVELAVVDPSVTWSEPVVRGLLARGVEVIGELEWAYRQAMCLHLAVAGTNGKSSAARLLTRVLVKAGRRVSCAGDRLRPLSGVVGKSRELDYLVVETEAGQLEGVTHFRPVVGILLNLAPGGSERWRTASDLARVTARLFRCQQSFDWAIVQSEALAQMRSYELELPSKVITFSANNPRADIWMDRGLLLSRLPGWVGPLLDMDTCRVAGPHHAENVMAVLAAGHVLRIPLGDMIRVLRMCEPEPGCYERLGKADGVVYVNDGRSTNLDALRGALQGMPPGEGGEPNIWLIAGGADDGQEFHDVGPLLARRVKGVFLLGTATERMRAAWSLFTPCTGFGSLLEAVQKAADIAVRGDVVLFSPACTSAGSCSSSQHRIEAFREALRQAVSGLELAGGLGRERGDGAGSRSLGADGGTSSDSFVRD